VREDLAAVLASWNAETPIPEEVRRQVQLEMDEAGFTATPGLPMQALPATSAGLGASGNGLGGSASSGSARDDPHFALGARARVRAGNMSPLGLFG